MADFGIKDSTYRTAHDERIRTISSHPSWHPANPYMQTRQARRKRTWWHRLTGR